MAARAAERIRALQREADDLAAKARSLFNDLRKLELDRAIAQQRVTEAEAALAAVTAQRDTAAKRVERIEAERVANTPGVAERLVSIYKRGRGGYAQLLLSSDDPRAFGRLTRGVAAIATLDRVRVEAHRRTLAAERSALADLENQRHQVASSQKAATKANQDLEKTVKARNNAIDAIDARRDLAAKYVAELQEAQAALQRRVGEVQHHHRARTAVPALPWRPGLAHERRGLTRFGPSRQGRFGTAIVRNGIEIKAAEGAPARAVHGGTVAFAEPFAGYGTLVIVDHGGGAFTMYGHLGDVRVARGDRVQRNGIIGTVGLAPAGESSPLFRGARRRPPRRSPTMAQEFTMNRRGRSIVLAISIPIVVFAAVGGFMSRAMAARGENSYQHLRIFEDVVTLITNNYVEDVDVNKVMHGAMHGLADGLDPDTRLPRRHPGRSAREERTAGLRPDRHRADPPVLPARDRGARWFAGGAGRPAARRLHPRDRRPVHARHLGVRRQAPAAGQAGHQGAPHRAPRQRRGSS